MLGSLATPEALHFILNCKYIDLFLGIVFLQSSYQFLVQFDFFPQQLH